MNFEDYESKLKVDKLRLDEALEYHAMYSNYFIKQCSLKEKELADAKTEHEKIKSQVELDYRTGVLKTDVKITEGSIKALVTTNPEVIHTLNEYNALKYDVALWKGKIKVWDDKKSALENEIKLFGMSYFSVPNSSGVSKKEVEVLDETEQKQKLRERKIRRNLLDD
jgi:hypothetical protein